MGRNRQTHVTKNKELIPNEMLERALIDIEYRSRIFSPDITITCLLSQALDDDQSLQASVHKMDTVENFVKWLEKFFVNIR